MYGRLRRRRPRARDLAISGQWPRSRRLVGQHCQIGAIMASYEWTRVQYYNKPLSASYYQLCTLTPGQTLARVHFGWGISGYSQITENPQNVMNAGIVLGLISMIGATAPPSPITTPTDPSRPESRWLWMEARHPMVTAILGNGDLAIWTDSPRSAPTDTKAQVKNPTGSGSNIVVYVSYDVQISYPSYGNWSLHFWANSLIES